MKLFSTTFAAAALAGGLAFAYTDMSWDMDGDGMMSYDERMAYFPNMTDEDFAGYDADADGMFNNDEMAMIETERFAGYRNPMPGIDDGDDAFPSNEQDAAILRGDETIGTD